MKSYKDLEIYKESFDTAIHLYSNQLLNLNLWLPFTLIPDGTKLHWNWIVLGEKYRNSSTMLTKTGKAGHQRSTSENNKSCRLSV